MRAIIVYGQRVIRSYSHYANSNVRVQAANRHISAHSYLGATAAVTALTACTIVSSATTRHNRRNVSFCESNRSSRSRNRKIMPPRYGKTIPYHIGRNFTTRVNPPETDEMNGLLESLSTAKTNKEDCPVCK